MYDHSSRPRRGPARSGEPVGANDFTPGKRTLTAAIQRMPEVAASTAAPGRQSITGPAYAASVQRRDGGDAEAATATATADVHAAAQRGIQTPAAALPYASTIQRLFGRHDVSQIRAHIGGDAAASAHAMHAQAYATGEHVVLPDGANLFTVAHEAAHVVQQRGVVHVAGGVGQAGDRYEQHADEVAQRVVRGESAEALLDELTGGPKPAAVRPDAVQHRQITSLAALTRNLTDELDTGERAAGSPAHFLPTKANAAKLTGLFTPGHLGDKDFQERALAKSKGNDYLEGWYDRVSQRVQEGAQHLAGSVLHWRADLEQRDNVETDVASVQLMGSDLHERGLGAARVDYLRDYGSGLFARLRAMVKPEDRSIEDALIGAGGSLAEQLNQQLPKSKRVPTLNMDVDKTHGTIMEYVETSLSSVTSSLLRRVGAFYDTDAVALEAIALAFLGGIWDLTDENIMLRGGAPVMIDADVAARPNEFKRPDRQNGLEGKSGNGNGPSRTDRIHGQLDGDGSHASQILQYAIEHPDTVIKMIRAAIGNHVARIVPVFTADWAGTLQIYVSMRARGAHADAREEVGNIARSVAAGQKGSKGLHGELGDDRGGAWDAKLVAKLIAQDFECGQLPTFSYQPSTGEAKYHGQTIWVGDNLDDSMTYLRLALEKGGGKKQL